MRTAIALVLVAFSLLSSIQARNSPQLLEDAIKYLPTCALSCMTTVISNSSCPMTDGLCIIQNEELNEQMAKCIKATCTIRESLTAKNFTESVFDRSQRDRTKMVSWIGMSGGIIALIVVAIRICARLPYFGGIWGWDDWAIIATMLPVLPFTGFAVVLANKGLGKDMWTVPFENITDILRIYYVDELCYLWAVGLTKISILLFYLRIFPNRSFRRLVFVCITICGLYVAGFVPATAFQCIPISLAWKRWDGNNEGRCFNLNVEGWLASAFNILLDIIVICLPLRELSKLAMSRRKKAGIMLMFLGGGGVTVVSVIRLEWMIQFANSENVTWDYAPVGYWSTLEVHVGIIIACLPALRALQHRLIPVRKHASSYYNNFSGTNGYNSRGGSQFKSLKGFKRNSQVTTGASQASMMRSGNRTHRDKEFIQLNEYDLRLDDNPDVEKSNGVGRGINRTQCERGDSNNDTVTLLSSPSLNAPLSLDSSSPPRPHEGIAIKKDYSVTVESGHSSLDESPPKLTLNVERRPK
ncbi:hypothetical protein CC78DRAFT_614375 [Lojkania enalia]|uniref:CFEM domain-containing protein n=1 Tax=Lojkania enalia TaxID=147567 RepID=A0A9P4KEN8_9PLEO|nr:hypothetical protein CC78DRAFT_614375 [Didymosphaeria enalia]